MMLSQNIYELEASPVEGQSLQLKGKKRRKRKGKIKLLYPLRQSKRVVSCCYSYTVLPRHTFCSKGTIMIRSIALLWAPHWHRYLLIFSWATMKELAPTIRWSCNLFLLQISGWQLLPIQQQKDALEVSILWMINTLTSDSPWRRKSTTNYCS